MKPVKIVRSNIGEAWADLLRHLVTDGNSMSPRGKKTWETVDLKFVVTDLRNNVLVDMVRKPQYRFMVAEWLWIWFGRDDVASIAQYNSRIAEFSDDGLTFAGAYGPMVAGQWNRVMNFLSHDVDSRQAVIQIFRPMEGYTKDTPCTISLQFLVRNGCLNCIANMRSSDAWLGLPYDFFNFSMLANIMAAELRLRTGWLSMNLGSSHLYDENRAQAETVLQMTATSFWKSPEFITRPPQRLEQCLVGATESGSYNLITPWQQYGRVLGSLDNKSAAFFMESLNASK
jgi:thymidylate synthase